jgi:transposase-like protein
MAKQEFSIPALMNLIPTEADAYEFLERLRWEDDVVCPHCGSVAKHYFLKPSDGSESRKTRTGNRSARRVWKCKDCRKQFSVLTGTIFHGSKIPVRTWIFVTFEVCASKNGVAAREIERKYDLTAKSAWFMVHRIREAMKGDAMQALMQGTIVADETWIGGKPGNRHGNKGYAGRQGKTDKQPVVSLINKETGVVRSVAVRNVTGENLADVLSGNVDVENSVLHTDTHKGYDAIGREFAEHHRVNHSEGEYVRGDVSTNMAEGFFSQLKRSVDGTHHKVSREHLGRYLAEFDFRYSTRAMDDSARFRFLAEFFGGRRLTYAPLTGQS